MTKKKIFGILEDESVLLEPVSETRYTLDGEVDNELIGQWLTVEGQVDEETVNAATITSVEKSSGKVTRSGVLVEDPPNRPAEANGAGGYLYQEGKGRYYLLSEGELGDPIQGNFDKLVGQNVRVRGELGHVSYILYNAKVSVK
jgi:hypothetical protein